MGTHIRTNAGRANALQKTKKNLIMDNCYLVVHKAQNRHVVAVCKGIEAAKILVGSLNQRAGQELYEITEKEFIW